MENKTDWRTSVINKQGYLIKFHRGFSVKAPKMQYFVLTANGLVSFNYKPEKDSIPLHVLTFEQLSSVKVERLGLNRCKLPCLLVTSKTSSNFLLAFSRKEERDEWMVAIMSAFSEALVATRQENAVTKSNAVLKAASLDEQMRIQRKRNRKSSLRRTKSCNAVSANEVKIAPEKNLDDNSRVSVSSISYEPSIKRKSLSDIHVITHDFPYAWVLEEQSQLLENRCFELCGPTEQARETKSNGKLSLISRIRARFTELSKT